MKGELALRTLIRSLLTEKESLDPVRQPTAGISGAAYTRFPADAKSLVVVMPGASRIYRDCWDGPACAKDEAEAKLPGGTAYVVAQNGTSCKMIFSKLPLEQYEKVILAGFSAGGNRCITFMGSGDPVLSKISQFYLIDPDIPSAVPAIPSDVVKRTYLDYNVSCWGTKYNQAAKIVDLKSKLSGAAGIIDRTGKPCAQGQPDYHINIFRQNMQIIGNSLT